MKLKNVIMAAGIIGVMTAATASADSEIKVFVDNKEVTFDQSPSLVNGRTMVPVRAVFEKAGANVEWNAETRTASLSKDGYEVSISIDQPFLVKNGKPVALDVPASIINDRLAIPVRAISEAMDFGVTWNGTRNSVLISTSGKAYRANSQWKTGFMTVQDAGFYVSADLNDIPYFDLDGNGETDALAFVPSKVLEDGSMNTPALWIGGACFNSVLDSTKKPYAIAVEDVISGDSYKEIFVFYNSEDGKCAGVYRYNGVDVFQMKANNSDDGMIYFNDNLFVDGEENIISDVDGMCFLDNMICTGVYSLEGSDICRYLWRPDISVGRTYTREYKDNHPYSYKEVTLYKKGEYVGSAKDNDIIFSNDIPGFKLLDYYVDDKDPSNFEFFVELPGGTTAVLWPYTV